jgi:two-component system response regulator YesN
MYRLLIVDDEKIIREGLRDSYDWNSYNISFIKTAANSMEAMSVIETFNPHIVLTDIHMPEIDGIELAKYIYSNHRHIYTVFLSAYSDFKYAQKAIEYNIKGYILKPLTQSNLDNVFIHISDELKRTYADQNQKMLIGILVGNEINSDNNPHLNLYIQNTFSAKHIRIVALSFKDSENKQFVINNNAKLENSLKYFSSMQIPAVIYMNYLVVCVMDSDPITKTNVLCIVEDYINKIGDDSYIVYAGVGNSIDGYSKMSNSFSQAIYILNSDLYNPDRNIIFYQDAMNNEQYSNNHCKNIGDYIDFLARAIGSGPAQEITHSAKLVFNYILLESKNNIQAIKLLMLNSFLDLYIRFVTGNVKFVFDAHVLTQRIYRAINIPQLQKIFFATIDEFADKHPSNENTDDHWIVADTRQYIQDNYESNISLSSISQKLHVSKSYLSSKFKKLTGMTITDYIVELRMTQACRLLANPNISISEVSYRIGYNDYGYFSRIFKKRYDITALQYRKKLLK